MKRFIVILIALGLCASAWALTDNIRLVIKREPGGGSGSPPYLQQYEVCWDTDLMNGATLDTVYASSYWLGSETTRIYDFIECATEWRSGHTQGTPPHYEPYIPSDGHYDDGIWPWIEVHFTESFHLGAVRFQISTNDSAEVMPGQVWVYTKFQELNTWEFCGSWLFNAHTLDACDVLEWIPPPGYQKWGKYIKIQLFNPFYFATEGSDLQIYAATRIGTCP